MVKSGICLCSSDNSDVEVCTTRSFCYLPVTVSSVFFLCGRYLHYIQQVPFFHAGGVQKGQDRSTQDLELMPRTRHVSFYFGFQRASNNKGATSSSSSIRFNTLYIAKQRRRDGKQSYTRREKGVLACIQGRERKICGIHSENEDSQRT